MIYRVFSIGLLVCLFMITCQAQKTKIGFISDGKPSMDVAMTTMNAAFKVLLDDGTEISQSAIIHKAKESFYYLYGEGTQNEKSVTIAIPLEADSDGKLFISAKSCKHECKSSPSNPCGGACALEIKENCKRIVCKCTTFGDGGGCDSSITTSIKLNDKFTSFFKK